MIQSGFLLSMNLTEHFTLEELTASDTAARKGIDNTPSKEVVENLKKLAQVLEQVRKVLGKPILVSSGFRCSALNKLVGSKPTSKHVQGMAADIKCPEFGDPKAVVEAISKSGIEFDQCIMEFYNPITGDGWCHIGISASPRKQLLTINGYGTFTGIRV